MQTRRNYVNKKFIFLQLQGIIHWINFHFLRITSGQKMSVLLPIILGAIFEFEKMWMPWNWTFHGKKSHVFSIITMYKKHNYYFCTCSKGSTRCNYVYCISKFYFKHNSSIIHITVEFAIKIIQSYYAAVSYIDHLIGKLLEQLRKNNLQENTIIILTSDHGNVGKVKKFRFYNLFFRIISRLVIRWTFRVGKVQ